MLTLIIVVELFSTVLSWLRTLGPLRPTLHLSLTLVGSFAGCCMKVPWEQVLHRSFYSRLPCLQFVASYDLISTWNNFFPSSQSSSVPSSVLYLWSTRHLQILATFLYDCASNYDALLGIWHTRHLRRYFATLRSSWFCTNVTRMYLF